MNKDMKIFLRVYTRRIWGLEYPAALAHSVHMAVSTDAKQYQRLNQNYGILFPEAEISADNLIIEKGVRCPCIYEITGGRFAILGVRVQADGSMEESVEENWLYWETADLIHFSQALYLTGKAAAERLGISGEKLPEKYLACRACLERPDQNLLPLPADTEASRRDPEEGRDLTMLDGNEIEISEEMAQGLLAAWLPIHQTAISVPQTVRIDSPEAMKRVYVRAGYSDGSEHRKPVDWDTTMLDFSRKGKQKINGKVCQPTYPFPLAIGYADPEIFYEGGKVYFIATNDNTDAVGLFIREADTIEALFSESVREYCILEKNAEKQLVQTFWAPELHRIGGEIYILFAVGGSVWGPQSHMMHLKKGGSLICASDWEAPIRVCRENGSFLIEDGITLDMTYLEQGGKSYLVWSQRWCLFGDKDSGSMLYLAPVSSKKPWQLTGEPVLLSRSLYGWENQAGTINNEGPYALYTKERTYIAYSGGSAGGYSYVAGFLSLPVSGDPMDPGQWEKSITADLSAYSVTGEYGPGHNTFFQDDRGDTYIVYHAQYERGRGIRCTGIRRVHFNVQGKPVLNLSRERDLDPQLADVSMEVEIC